MSELLQYLRKIPDGDVITFRMDRENRRLILTRQNYLFEQVERMLPDMELMIARSPERAMINALDMMAERLRSRHIKKASA